MRAVRGADTAHMRNSSGSWLQSQKQTFYCSKGADGTTFPQVDLGAMIDSYESEAVDRLNDKEQNRNFGTTCFPSRLPCARPFLGAGWNRVGVTLRRGD
jgi:hypothetical protein